MLFNQQYYLQVGKQKLVSISQGGVKNKPVRVNHLGYSCFCKAHKKCLFPPWKFNPKTLEGANQFLLCSPNHLIFLPS